jgi:hypothetical protein
LDFEMTYAARDSHSHRRRVWSLISKTTEWMLSRSVQTYCGEIIGFRDDLCRTRQPLTPTTGLLFDHITARHSTSQHVTARHGTSRHVTSQHVTARHSTSPKRWSDTPTTGLEIDLQNDGVDTSSDCPSVLRDTRPWCGGVMTEPTHMIKRFPLHPTSIHDRVADVATCTRKRHYYW